MVNSKDIMLMAWLKYPLNHTGLVWEVEVVPVATVAATSLMCDKVYINVCSLNCQLIIA